MTCAINTAPAATVELAARRSVENHVHSARFYGDHASRTRPVAVILEELATELAALGRIAIGPDGGAEARRESLRAQWQYATGWAREARQGLAARHVSRIGQLTESDKWARSAIVHADVTTCTGGKGARHEGHGQPLRDVLGPRRCTSDVCGPVFARIDAERAQ